MEIDFPALFEEHYDQIAAYLTRRQIDRSTAENLAQMTFVEAYDRRATYDPRKGTERGWLFGIATNLMRDHFRSECRRLRAYGRAASRQVQPQVSCDEICGCVDARATAGAIAAALATLSRGGYEVLTLHCWAELSDEEIAIAAGVPKGTVKSRLNRARHQARTRLDQNSLERTMNELELIRSFGRNDTTPNPAARAAARDRLLAHIADDRSTTNPSGQFPTWLPDVITAAAEGLANEDALARKQISSDVVTVQQVVRCLPADIAATQKMRDRPRTSPGNADLSYLDRLILKPWGSEFRVYEDDFTDVWCVNIKPEHRTSLHCHLRKLAAILCLGGKGTLSTCSGVRYALEPGVVLQIEPGAYHRSAATSAGLLLIEIETPKDKLDLLCIEDDYRTSAYAYEDEHHIPLRIVEREHAVAGPRALQPFVEQHLAGNHRARLRAQDSTGYHFAVETGDQIRTSSYHLVFAIELQPGATTLRDLTVIGPQRVFTAVPGNVYLTIRPLKQ